MIWIFLDHIDVELYQNEKMHVHFLLPCFAVRKGFHPMILKVFFPAGESQTEVKLKGRCLALQFN